MADVKKAKALNICGVAVYLAPDAADDLTDRIVALPGVELEAVSGENRLAVTVIDTPDALAIDQIAAIHRLPGVVAASLIFHAFDDEADSQNEATACRAGACQDHSHHHGAHAPHPSI